MGILQPTDETITQAASMLKAGLLVAFPTETVYGLGADASNAEAVARLYAAKGRPGEHPVIVHLANASMIGNWASRVPEGALRLAEAFWPGPLTLILPKAEAVLSRVTGGQDTVGLRVPSHPVAQRLLTAFGGGVAAPSANKFGKLSPTRAADVAAEFQAEVSLVLEGGACEVGIESTIVDFSGERPRILRPGMISAQQIEALAGPMVAGNVHGQAVRAPGTLRSHYAPGTPCRLIEGAQLAQQLSALSAQGKEVCVLSFQERPGCRKWIKAADQPRRYAQELYKNLRELDAQHADVILVESVPASEEWAAVADRLQRAAADAEEGSEQSRASLTSSGSDTAYRQAGDGGGERR